MNLIRLFSVLCLAMRSLASISPPQPFSAGLNDILRDLDFGRRQEQSGDGLIEPKVTETAVIDLGENTASSPSRTLEPASTPIPLAATMGLIMPNPWSKLYVGVNYSFGFVDPVARPAPTVGGWIRHVQPLLIFPDYTVNVFPGTGAESPEDASAVPPGSSGLCGATAENWAYSYPFQFLNSGWYMFVINQTWIEPTVTNNTCALPLISQKSFFSYQTLSIAPSPTYAAGPANPTAAYTVFAKVSAQTPTRLPYDKEPATSSQKLALGFGITGAVLVMVLIGGVVWWVRRKHKMDRETLAFSRLSESDKAAFLAENPEHFLNPAQPSKQRHWSFDNKEGPPAPPGTMAFAQWYMAQMRERQMNNWRWGSGRSTNEWRSVDMSGQQGAPYGYQGASGMAAQGYGRDGQMLPPMSQMGGVGGTQPILVYNTR